jgi:hypothetical protein
MKKIVSIFSLFIFVVIALALSISNNAKATCIDCPPPAPSATPTPTALPPVIEAWDSGNEFEIDQSAVTPPDEWSQSLYSGVRVDTAGTICHPFRKGALGWTASIYKWTGNGWLELDTTLGWVPDKEGTFMACAYAPSAGTYALFGYYDPNK